MDTLTISKELAKAGLSQDHADVTARVIGAHGRSELVTKSQLDVRLWRHTALLMTVMGIAILFVLAT